MSRSLLADAFVHHNWATLRLLDACADLDTVQLDTAVPGTYGSIIDTLRHLVGADSGYLFVTTGERFPLLEEERLGGKDEQHAEDLPPPAVPVYIAERLLRSWGAACGERGPPAQGLNTVSPCHSRNSRKGGGSGGRGSRTSCLSSA